MFIVFFNTLRAEWTKLYTTKALWWTSALIVFFGLLLAFFAGKNVEQSFMGYSVLSASNVVSGVAGISIIVVAIQAIMVVTAEYRHKYQSVTFMATPNRHVVAAAKLALYGLLSAALTFVTVIMCFYLAKMVATPEQSKTLDVWNDDIALRIMWVYPLVSFLLTVFAQGIAFIVRQTAGAMALVLIWMTTLEGVGSLIPKVGDYVQKYGPFTNMNAFILNSPIDDASWGVNGSGWYFAAWVVALYVIGQVLLAKRDA